MGGVLLADALGWVGVLKLTPMGHSQATLPVVHSRCRSYLKHVCIFVLEEEQKRIGNNPYSGWLQFVLCLREKGPAVRLLRVA
jgi:hypothetical protein